MTLNNLYSENLKKTVKNLHTGILAVGLHVIVEMKQPKMSISRCLATWIVFSQAMKIMQH